ncbi:DDB1- and CUL4-associated factor 8-like protein [Aduncisulcus paluster]|uniref:DDB1- and CUL4-associated factor 8-like protein n=1 Tax=Aduncisulcus paluster TaxID=2918883 RepID=A0ABQ5KPU2_9EUKA|nr:DDB1- and CUL4-associated factor 8-like protein [Aduncisulcus paluster]
MIPSSISCWRDINDSHCLFNPVDVYVPPFNCISTFLRNDLSTITACNYKSDLFIYSISSSSSIRPVVKQVGTLSLPEEPSHIAMCSTTLMTSKKSEISVYNNILDELFPSESSIHHVSHLQDVAVSPSLTLQTQKLAGDISFIAINSIGASGVCVSEDGIGIFDLKSGSTKPVTEQRIRTGSMTTLSLIPPAIHSLPHVPFTYADFSPLDPSLCLSCCAGAVALIDTRVCKHQVSVKTITHGNTPTVVKFAPLMPHFFVSGTEKGHVLLWDIRSTARPAQVCSSESSGAISDICFHPSLPSIMACGTTTGCIDIWDLYKCCKYQEGRPMSGLQGSGGFWDLEQGWSGMSKCIMDSWHKTKISGGDEEGSRMKYPASMATSVSSSSSNRTGVGSYHSSSSGSSYAATSIHTVSSYGGSDGSSSTASSSTIFPNKYDIIDPFSRVSYDPHYRDRKKSSMGMMDSHVQQEGCEVSSILSFSDGFSEHIERKRKTKLSGIPGIVTALCWAHDTLVGININPPTTSQVSSHSKKPEELAQKAPISESYLQPFSILKGRLDDSRVGGDLQEEDEESFHKVPQVFSYYPDLTKRAHLPPFNSTDMAYLNATAGRSLFLGDKKQGIQSLLDESKKLLTVITDPEPSLELLGYGTRTNLVSTQDSLPVTFLPPPFSSLPFLFSTCRKILRTATVANMTRLDSRQRCLELCTHEFFEEQIERLGPFRIVSVNQIARAVNEDRIKLYTTHCEFLRCVCEGVWKEMSTLMGDEMEEEELEEGEEEDIGDIDMKKMRKREHPKFLDELDVTSAKDQYRGIQRTGRPESGMKEPRRIDDEGSANPYSSVSDATNSSQGDMKHQISQDGQPELRVEETTPTKVLSFAYESPPSLTSLLLSSSLSVPIIGEDLQGTLTSLSSGLLSQLDEHPTLLNGSHIASLLTFSLSLAHDLLASTQLALHLTHLCSKTLSIESSYRLLLTPLAPLIYEQGGLTREILYEIAETPWRWNEEDMLRLMLYPIAMVSKNRYDLVDRIRKDETIQKTFTDASSSSSSSFSDSLPLIFSPLSSSLLCNVCDYSPQMDSVIKVAARVHEEEENEKRKQVGEEKTDKPPLSPSPVPSLTSLLLSNLHLFISLLSCCQHEVHPLRFSEFVTDHTPISQTCVCVGICACVCGRKYKEAILLAQRAHNKIYAVRSNMMEQQLFQNSSLQSQSQERDNPKHSTGGVRMSPEMVGMSFSKLIDDLLKVCVWNKLIEDLTHIRGLMKTDSRIRLQREEKRKKREHESKQRQKLDQESSEQQKKHNILSGDVSDHRMSTGSEEEEDSILSSSQYQDGEMAYSEQEDCLNVICEAVFCLCNVPSKSEPSQKEKKLLGDLIKECINLVDYSFRDDMDACIKWHDQLKKSMEGGGEGIRGFDELLKGIASY